MHLKKSYIILDTRSMSEGCKNRWCRHFSNLPTEYKYTAVIQGICHIN